MSKYRCVKKCFFNKRMRFPGETYDIDADVGPDNKCLRRLGRPPKNAAKTDDASLGIDTED